MSDQNLNPYLLAANTPSPDPRLLPLLRSNPALASQQDAHGYSLLHAAASYNHVDLLRTLVNEFGVDVELKDEDGETCLYVAETVEVARCLIEELGIDTKIRNYDEGMTAAEKVASEGEYPELANYLQQFEDSTAAGSAGGNVQANGVGHPPPLPPNMSISINTAAEDHVGDVDDQQPDPEFRRRIEELASRENFNTAEGQQELRDLITDAVRGVSNEEREVRRRIDS